MQLLTRVETMIVQREGILLNVANDAFETCLQFGSGQRFVESRVFGTRVVNKTFDEGHNASKTSKSRVIIDEVLDDVVFNGGL